MPLGDSRYAAGILTIFPGPAVAYPHTNKSNVAKGYVKDNRSTIAGIWAFGCVFCMGHGCDALQKYLVKEDNDEIMADAEV